jgi:hypothetical protein
VQALIDRFGDRLGMSVSVQRIIAAVSGNESGFFDGCQMYDAGLVSFGIIQWASHKGALWLERLLARFKKDYPALFEKYFTSMELDVVEDDPQHAWFVLKGEKLDSDDKIKKMRSLRFAYHLRMAAREPAMQAHQLRSAAGWLSFYFAAMEPAKRYDRYATSEHLVALLLDHSVNAPGKLRGSWDMALQLLDAQHGIDAAEYNATEHESKLIECFEIARNGRMHDAMGRAAKIAARAKDGRLNPAPHSFVYALSKTPPDLKEMYKAPENAPPGDAPKGVEDFGGVVQGPAGPMKKWPFRLKRNGGAVTLEGLTGKGATTGNEFKNGVFLTDANGKFDFKKLPQADYTVEVMLPGGELLVIEETPPTGFKESGRRSEPPPPVVMTAEENPENMSDQDEA